MPVRALDGRGFAGFSASMTNRIAHQYYYGTHSLRAFGVPA
ncbi:hypothetical protein [uncultured Tateyamaria sp.]|nr:hypothetical protein [uncultured Tateyamaria sp.]